ncbi:MAG: hypothetical protein Q4D13_01570 [Erysipelotrichaceae bacterium]|nr:hypothetical protein [Erysipelotrichaceae bacterium]
MKTVDRKRSGYDILILDHEGSDFFCYISLMVTLGVGYDLSKKIVSKMPQYLYTDLDKEDAENIVTDLKKKGIRTAVISPSNSIVYYSPYKENKPVPKNIPINRNAMLILDKNRKPLGAKRVSAPRPAIKPISEQMFTNKFVKDPKENPVPKHFRGKYDRLEKKETEK